MKGYRSEVNPGVWVSEREKLGQVGVWVRRRVGGFGVGVNVTREVEGGFERIEGCGLKGVRAGWLVKEGGNGDGGEREREVGERLAGEMAGLLEGVEGVRKVGGVDEILGREGG